MSDDAASSFAPERFREYLLVLARQQVGRALDGKLDLSGVVQQTLLDAHRAGEPMGDWDDPRRLAWLRRALARNLTDELRKIRAGKRDVGREHRLEAALEESASRLEVWLAAEHSSPSQRADRNEQLLRLAEALGRLPDAQREAVTLHYWQGRSLAEIAASMGRTPAAVAGLLKRGLQQLRQVLHEPEGGR
jgi:RNA polymerase sigma-70 factor (ECF subfamily)